jgi:hypothetical protein
MAASSRAADSAAVTTRMSERTFKEEKDYLCEVPTVRP